MSEPVTAEVDAYMNEQFSDDIDEAEFDDLFLLLDISARKLLRSSSSEAFLDWIAASGPSLMPSALEHLDVAAGAPSQLFRTMGVAIYNAMPQPENNFRPRRLPLPGRNEPCLCGSGEKYKRCCLPLKDGFGLDGYNMLRHVLDNLPRKNFSALPGTAAEPLAVADTARQWSEEGYPARAVALLEPWFSQRDEFGAELEELFDELMACYLALGNSRKRDKLVDKLLAQGDKTMRAVAMQRRSMMLADQGDVVGAWQAYSAAQRMDPDNLTLVALELTLLLAQGQHAQARERALFWLARLERMRNPELIGLIEFLHVVRDDPMRALAVADQNRHPGLAQLEALLAAAPPIELHHAVRKQGDDAHVLEPDAALLKLEKRWRRVYPQAKPNLTATQSGDDGMWLDVDAWLSFLKTNALCWQSFDVLDDLVLAVDALQALGTDKTLLEPLLVRSVTLLDHHLGPSFGDQETLAWSWMENRPALRSLAHLCVLVLEDPARGAPSDAFIALAERLLSLNPNDNHGMRESLSRAYLTRGWPDKAITLTDSYPEDFCGPALNRILALHLVGRDADARDELSAVAQEHQTAIKMLLAKKPQQPKREAYFGVALGGAQEAWLYRTSSLALWERDGAIEWLRKACKKLP